VQVKLRLVILTELIAPYRIPVFNALSKMAEIDLHVIFLAENDPGLRQWLVYKAEIEFSYQTLPSARWRVAGQNILLNRGLNSALADSSIDALICGGYNYLASWQARSWAKANHVPFLLWVESTREDQRGNRAVVEFLKSKFIGGCDAFVVPGLSSSRYLQHYGVPSDKIFTAPNAVDNDHFGEIATRTRSNTHSFRAKLGLPSRYFLFSGRLVPEKGVFELVEAYCAVSPSIREGFGLVFAGDGPCFAELQKQALGTRNVHFLGFRQRDDLASVMALATTLVLPTHSDTWGLVVNEAMACGLPVIVSHVAGCAADLVRDGWNGLIVRPRNPQSLAAALDRMARDEHQCSQMGRNSLTRIRDFSPATCAGGLATAARASKKAAACA
jgi:1,2-diacylglycerol 3-alpha-glucosyltransferase